MMVFLFNKRTKCTPEYQGRNKYGTNGELNKDQREADDDIWWSQRHSGDISYPRGHARGRR